MKRWVAAKYVGCLGIIHQINISIQRNMPIICFCFFYPFRSENKLLGGTSNTYQGKFSEDDVTEIVHNNRCKFEPYAELVDEVYENFNAELVDNQDAYGQIESDETDHTMKMQEKQKIQRIVMQIYTLQQV